MATCCRWLLPLLMLHVRQIHSQLWPLARVLCEATSRPIKNKRIAPEIFQHFHGRRCRASEQFQSTNHRFFQMKRFGEQTCREMCADGMNIFFAFDFDNEMGCGRHTDRRDFHTLSSAPCRHEIRQLKLGSLWMGLPELGFRFSCHTASPFACDRHTEQRTASTKCIQFRCRRR